MNSPFPFMPIDVAAIDLRHLVGRRSKHAGGHQPAERPKHWKRKSKKARKGARKT